MTSTSSATAERWSEHLVTVAGPGVDAGVSAIRVLGPSLGRAFSAVVAGTDAGTTPEIRPGDREVGLWWAVQDEGIDIEPLIAEPTDGSLWPVPDVGLEVWTEVELCGLHALWWIARRRSSPTLVRRIDDLRKWHMENTQPDNATFRPWALQVFALDEDPESQLYAETLLHNAMITGPEPLSAWILQDAARALRGET